MAAGRAGSGRRSFDVAGAVAGEAWFAEQPIDYTGKVLSIAELREMGVVRPFTPAKR